MRILVTGLYICSSLLVLSCGGGGGNSTIPSVEPVARLDVTPAAILLNGSGQHQNLTVRAFSASGAEIKNAPITFTSSRATQISVDSTGAVTAVTPVGSAQITVSSGKVSAAPVAAISGETYPGTLLIADEQFTTSPQPVSSTVEGLGSRYTVGIRGIASPPLQAALRSNHR